MYSDNNKQINIMKTFLSKQKHQITFIAIVAIYFLTQFLR